MVSFQKIKASNARLTSIPRVALFVGGTSGVGRYTIEALLRTGLKTKIYIVGRQSAATRTTTFITQMSATNPNAELIWIEGEISLMKETRRICDKIRERESRLDLLFLSAGYAPFGTRKQTEEGLEVAGSLEYYSRMLFIQRLLPILGSGRVISVLAGGKEQKVDLNDLHLKNEKNFSGFGAQVLYATMNTMTMEKLAVITPNTTFIHAFPGWVNTGNMSRGHDPGLMAWFSRNVVSRMISPFCLSEEESGQRSLFQCTSSAYGAHGASWEGQSMHNSEGRQKNGLFLVNDQCDISPNEMVISALRLQGQEEIWHHTQTVLEPYL